MKAKTYSALQKTYDQSYLVCSTAVYYESQGNESEALRCWRECLAQLMSFNSYSHRSRNETEAVLLRSLKELKERCEDRVRMLQAIMLSRKEAGVDGPGETGTPMVLGGGIPILDGPSMQNATPPAGTLSAPAMHRRSLSQQQAVRPDPTPLGGFRSATSNTLVPMTTPPHALTPTPPLKDGRDASPDKRAFLPTLRPPKKTKKKDQGTDEFTKKYGPAAAAKAATLAWGTGADTSESSRRTSMEDAATRSVASRSAGDLPIGERSSSLGHGSGSSSNSSLGEPKSRSTASRPRTTIPVSAVMPNPSKFVYTPPPPPHRVPVRRTSSPRKKAPTESHSPRPSVDGRSKRAPPAPPPRVPREPPRSDHLTDANRSTSELLTRTSHSASPSPSSHSRRYSHNDPRPRRRRADAPLPRTPTDTSDSEASCSSPPPADGSWQERIDNAIKRIGKSADAEAVRQVANEIVVKGDEVHWEDVAGLETAKLALKEAVVYPFLRPDLFSGLREPARGMLLFGPPGTGKTMLARAVATESKSTFFSISASSLTSKYLGESEKLVRALFALAKALAPSIIFVDEIDSLLSERSGSGEHEATRRIKTEFLIQWSDLARAAAGKETTVGDASRVLVLAATNLPWAIDEAARRRFVRRQYIPLPESDTRKKQLKSLLGYQKCGLSEEEMDVLVEMTEGFSGSDVTALAKDAAMGPLRSLGERLMSVTMEEIRAIELGDFEKSLVSIRPSVSREGLKRFEEWAGLYGERA